MRYFILFVFSFLLIFTLSGCTDIASKADDLERSIHQLKSDMAHLEKKEKLTERDQQIIKEDIDHFQKSFVEFKNEKAPSFLRRAQKESIEKLNKSNEILASIQVKAVERRAVKEDVRAIRKALSDDFNIRVFNK